MDGVQIYVIKAFSYIGNKVYLVLLLVFSRLCTL